VADQRERILRWLATYLAAPTPQAADLNAADLNAANLNAQNLEAAS
jgi:hypothetical protein